MKNPINPKTHPFCYSGYQYALDVVSGKIPNCKFIVGACKRFLSDYSAGKYVFDTEVAERYLRLVQKFSHINGEWKTKNVEFEPWQNFLFMNIMGFIHPDTGYRRFRTAHIEVPRGQGKSLAASQMGLYFLALCNPVGNEISCAATKSDQARIVLDVARNMARANPAFLKSTGTQVLAHKIVHPKSNSVMKALSSDSKSLDGLKDVLAIIDELHAVSRDLFDVISSGMKKRRDSLILCITTAGFDTDGVGHSQSQYARKVSIGEVEDDTFFSAVYTIDEGDDIFDEVSWKKANPNYGVSVDPIAFEATAKKAMEVPSDLANFKVKNLNIWLSEARAFFDTNKLDLYANKALTLEDFRGEKCIVGVDIASKVDLTSFGYVFKRDGKYYIFDKSFIPEDTVKEVKSSLYDNCIGQGYLTKTKGNAINYDDLKSSILEHSKIFKIQEVLYDPWNATEFAQYLQKEKINVTEFRFNTANLSEPTKMLDALIREGRVIYNGSPLLKWAFGNVVCKEDAAGNVFPKKSHEKLKIDPAIAIIMAFASWIQKAQKESVYQTRGIIHF
jgi:phage terminase large subunit-like protein